MTVRMSAQAVLMLAFTHCSIAPVRSDDTEQAEGPVLVQIDFAKAANPASNPANSLRVHVNGLLRENVTTRDSLIAILEKLSRRDIVLARYDGKAVDESLGQEIWSVRAICRRKDIALHYLNLNEKDYLVLLWSAPYDNPRDLSGSTFYLQSGPVGKAKEGFDAAVAKIKQARPKKLYVGSSTYTKAGSWSPEETPFDYDRVIELPVEVHWLSEGPSRLTPAP